MISKRTSIVILIVITLGLVALVQVESYIAQRSPIPAKAFNALVGAHTSTLYALDHGDSLDYGGDTFHYFKELGQTKLGIARSLVASEVLKWSISKAEPSLCALAPRHAVRVSQNSHSYDFIVCYSCGQVEILEDDKQLDLLSVSKFPLAIFDFLLTTDNIPTTINKVNSEEIAKINARHIELVAMRKKLDDESVIQWENSTPISIHEMLGSSVELNRINVDVAPYHAALTKEFPDKKDQMVSLLNWLGADPGIWQRSESPLFFSVLIPEKMLLNYSIEDICSIIRSGVLTQQQLRGAARYFADRFGPLLDNDHSALRYFQYHYPEVRKALLENVMHYGDPRNVDYAINYFGKS